MTWFNELKIIWSDISAISFSSSFLNAGEKVLISPPKYFLANFDSYKPEQHEPSKYSDIIGASEKVEKALRAIRICQPLKVPPSGYEKWKDLQLNFNPAEMLKG